VHLVAYSILPQLVACCILLQESAKRAVSINQKFLQNVAWHSNAEWDVPDKMRSLHNA
jgi:hypothetical protein